MSNLGKIFILEKNPHHLRQYVSALEERGFFPFGTDNLYLLIQYAKEVKPDVVIINIPKGHILSKEDISEIESTLCKKECPNIYINQHVEFAQTPNFHYWEFDDETVSYEQVLNIVKQAMYNKTLH